MRGPCLLETEKYREVFKLSLDQILSLENCANAVASNFELYFHVLL